MFKRAWFEVLSVAPQLVKTVRYWDKAGSKHSTSARTCGVKMGMDRKGLFYVLDVLVGKWSALEREQIIRQTAELDGQQTEIWIEQEGGSGGKADADATIRNLAGFNVHKETAVTGKEIRARPFAAQCEAENVKLIRGRWNHDYIEELVAFPAGRYADQVDASSGCFNQLAAPRQVRTARARAIF
jgi:predicted phage terminase large subunit-like protein